MDLARLQFEIDAPERWHGKLFFMSVMRGQFESPDSCDLPSFCPDLPIGDSFTSHIVIFVHVEAEDSSWLSFSILDRSYLVCFMHEILLVTSKSLSL